MQVACQVIGNDAAIATGGLGGVGSLLELNVAMPMMADNLQQSITLLSGVATILNDKCIRELQVNRNRASNFVEQSLMMCTALAPELGYDKAAEIAKAAFASGLAVREYVLKHDLLDEQTLDELLDARTMTEPGE